jgi:hypothetical protein
VRGINCTLASGVARRHSSCRAVAIPLGSLPSKQFAGP